MDSSQLPSASAKYAEPFEDQPSDQSRSPVQGQLLQVQSGESQPVPIQHTQQPPAQGTPGQQDSADDNGMVITDLPPEILVTIMENLAETGDKRFYHKTDLLAVRLSNKTLRDAADVPCFRNLSITLSLQDDIPRRREAWTPRKWEVPRPMQALQDSPSLGALITSLRLRILVFCLKDWTNEAFEDIIRRFRLSIGSDMQTHHRLYVSPLGVDTAMKSRRQADRQVWIMNAYADLFDARCTDHGMAYGVSRRAWAEDASTVLQPLISLLPSLRHLESEPMVPGIRHAPQRTLGGGHEISYADRLILRIAPRTADSVLVRTWPVGSHNFFRDSVDFRVAGPQAEIFGRTTALSTFTLEHARWLNLGPAPLTPSTFWQDNLHQLQSLTRLTLAQTREIMTTQAQTSNTTQDIAQVLGVAQFTNVRHVTLRYWILDGSFLDVRPGTCPGFRHNLGFHFPSVYDLTLQNTALNARKHREGEMLWIRILTQLRQNLEGSIELISPKVYMPHPIRESRLKIVGKGVRKDLLALI